MRQFIAILLVACAWLPTSARATTYYVDFDEGRDTGDGMSKDTPWQHAPGDPAVAKQSIPGRTALKPGDTVLFKGGVAYRGGIEVVASGETGRPITYKGDGWPGLETKRAIIDGSDPPAGKWTKCAQAVACAESYGRGSAEKRRSKKVRRGLRQMRVDEKGEKKRLAAHL